MLLEIEKSLMELRRKIEEHYGEPLIAVDFDFSQMHQSLIFKSGKSVLYEIKQDNIYAGHWIKFHWGKDFPDCFTSRYFFLDEIKHGDHEKWLAECRREFYKTRCKTADETFKEVFKDY